MVKYVASLAVIAAASSKCNEEIAESRRNRPFKTIILLKKKISIKHQPFN
jgi:hypothetical protein